MREDTMRRGVESMRLSRHYDADTSVGCRAVNVRENLSGVPVIGGIEGDDLAILADDHGGE
jgi:hypothetical protein